MMDGQYIKVVVACFLTISLYTPMIEASTEIVVTKEIGPSHVITENRKSFIGDESKQVIFRNSYGKEEILWHTIVEDNSLLIPLDEYINISPYYVEWNKNLKTYYLRMPIGRIEKDRIHFDTFGAAEMIALPIIKKNGVDYIDIKGNPYLGITSKRQGNTIYVEASSTIELGEKKEVTTPIQWVFDPLMNEEPYGMEMGNTGSFIISPSLFELTKKGVKESRKLSYEYIQSYKEKGYRVWPLITNQFNPDLTSEILDNESMWIHYKQQLINYALLYGYDGYNFDFENVHFKDREKLSKFVAYLSAGLQAFHIYTSIDVTGYSDSPNWSKVYDRTSLGQSVDYVVLMAYDETWASSTVAGPVASYPWVRKHTERVLSEVPKEKLVLGIPFYMREWDIPVKGTFEGKAKGKTLPMAKAEEIKKQFRDSLIWDGTLKNHYIELVKKGESYSAYKPSQSFSGTVTKIWFEDEDSLREKLGIVKDLQLSGYAAWRKGFEVPQIWQMIERTLESNKRELEIPKVLSKEEIKALEKLKKEQEKEKKKAEKKRRQEERKTKKTLHKN